MAHCARLLSSFLTPALHFFFKLPEGGEWVPLALHQAVGSVR